MEEMVFAADPVRLIAAAVVGIAVLLILIIRFKLHPIISMMLSAVIIGVGAGMPLSMISETVEKRCRESHCLLVWAPCLAVFLRQAAVHRKLQRH